MKNTFRFIVFRFETIVSMIEEVSSNLWPVVDIVVYTDHVTEA